MAAFAGRVVAAGLTEGNSGARLGGAVGGILVWLLVLAFQRRPFRAHVYGGGEPARMIGPGFAAAIGCGLLEAIVILALAR